jgi:hypothetical protein
LSSSRTTDQLHRGHRRPTGQSGAPSPDADIFLVALVLEAFVNEPLSHGLNHQLYFTGGPGLPTKETVIVEFRPAQVS